MISYVVGDATDPQGPGNKFIVHVCNNIGKWGAGFVVALSKKWYRPESSFRAFSELGLELGETFYVQVENSIWVANMVAQNGVKSRHNEHPLSYSALEECLEDVAIQAEFMNASIHMPRIGCGLAGGSWNKVEAIINKTMPDLSVTVYDLE